VGTCGGKQLDSLGTTCHDTESLIWILKRMGNLILPLSTERSGLND
jgi:hypothetical protein